MRAVASEFGLVGLHVNTSYKEILQYESYPVVLLESLQLKLRVVFV